MRAITQRLAVLEARAPEGTTALLLDIRREMSEASKKQLALPPPDVTPLVDELAAYVERELSQWSERSERLVAGQIADVKESLDSMRETMGKRAPPQVTVNVPERRVNVRVPGEVPPNVHLNFLEPPPQPTQSRFDVPEISRRRSSRLKRPS